MRPGARVFALAALALSGTLFISAQVTTGTLTGTVTLDGQPLPGVTITIASPAMQGTRAAYSYVNGGYNFANLPPGEYTVTFELEGLTPLTNTVTVALSRIERLNAALLPAPVTEAVTVTAAAPNVLETTEVQANFDAKLVDELPVQRTIQGITLLAPGVVNLTPGGSGNISISGGEYFDNLYLVNGAVTNENVFGQTDNLFIEDAIQETSVMSGAISAEYGRFTGGVVSAITKSGGNEYSGSFRDSFTNPAWTNASAYGEPKAESSLGEIYEATLGGRIVRDQLWFFVAGRYAEQQQEFTYTASTVTRPPNRQTDKRVESKLTAQLGSKHSLVTSWLDYEVEQTNVCAQGCWDELALDPWRILPRYMGTARYNGILSSDLLLEAGYSTRSLKFVDSGGDDPSQVYGTWGAVKGIGTGLFGAPRFCGYCEPESRTNDYADAKLTWYVPTTRGGTHNVVAGYENFVEERWANNYQSGSNFAVYIYNQPPVRDEAFNVLPVITGSADSSFGLGDIIVYFPILEPTRGDRLRTESVFVNDKWDLNRFVSLNLGFRYDRNHGKDSSGNVIANDDSVSPRLGVIVDVRGDGRLRVNASYSEYVARIWEFQASRLGAAGNPAMYMYEYRGPTISGLPVHQAFTQLFDWFNAQGGIDATDLVVFADIPGYSTKLDGMLKSPNVSEYVVGLGMQLGAKGFVRVDYIDRDWHDFYTNYNVPGLTSDPDPFGNVYDLTLVTNTDDLERTYKAVTLQGSYRLADRLTLGGNYTWSKAWGNYVDGDGFSPDYHPYTYAEYKGYEEFLPTGYLPNDRTHVARLWLGYDQPLGRFGSLNVSLLERYESGFPYTQWGNILVSPYVTNPGYLTPPRTLWYAFSGLGEYRFEASTSTDLALNYELPIRKASVFLQTEILNLFDEQAQINGLYPSARIVKRFNPFTETPLECPQGQADCTGYHWQKRSNFGAPTNKTSYQQPLTYRFSVGVRF